MSQTLSVPPQIPARKSPSHDQTNNGCTHTIMSRIFDDDHVLKCSMCHRPPPIGWLFRCTQDSNGYLPQSDFVVQHDKQNRLIKNDPSMHSLSPSITQGISNGQYTEDQIKVLVEQKEQVRDTILVHETRPPTATSTEESTTFSTLPESTTFSTNSSVSLDEELRSAYDWTELHKVWHSDSSTTAGVSRCPALSSNAAAADLPIITPCGFKVCLTCRPTYRERAFQSIEVVLKNPILPPIWELRNRRVSDASVLSRMDWTKPKTVQSTSSFGGRDSNESFYQVSTQNDGDISANDSNHSLEEGYAHSIRCRSGFRETVRKALTRARNNDHLSFAQNKPSSESLNESTSSRSQSGSRSMLFMRRISRTSVPPAEHRGDVIQNNGLQDSLMLMLASNTPLPQGPPTPYWVMDEQEKD